MSKKKEIIVQQHDQKDCGVACLLSLLQYYGGNASLERLRELSGTTTTGTKLIGLYQAANALGFKAEGCEADTNALIKHAKPVILHVELEGGMQHYVVCYGYKDGSFKIGEPGIGKIIEWDIDELNTKWKSKYCLILHPINIEQKESVRKNQLQWLKYIIQEDIPILSIATVIGLFIAALGLIMAIFSQKLIDEILPDKDITKLTLGIVVVGLLLLVRIIFQRIRGVLLIRQSKDFNNRVIGEFYNKLIALPKWFFDSRKIGDLVARLNDTARIQRVITLVLGNAIIEFLVVITSLILVLVYSWQTAILILMCLPMIFWVVYKFNTPVYTAQSDVMAGYAQTESFFINSMSAITPIKQLTLEEIFKDSNKQLYNQYQEKNYKLGAINVSLSFVVGLISVVFLVALLVFTSYQVVNDVILLGELAAILGVASSVFSSTVSLALLNIPLNEAKVAFNRMFEYLNLEKEESGEIKIDRISSISFNKVSFRYPGNKSILEEADWQLKKGELVLLTGDNGSGKSTIAQLIQKFYSLESGTIFFNDNIPLSSIDNQSLRRKVGAVDQEVNVFDGTVASNLMYAKSDADIKYVESFLSENGFDYYFQKLPQGYATLIGEDGVNLSGGQKRLIGIARAFLKDPDVLILDEPENDLDREAIDFLIKLVNRYKSEKIIIIISHRNHFSGIADKTYNLQNRQVKAFVNN